MNEQNIKDYFKFHCEPLANPNAIISGDNYRITMLTDRLVRFEYKTEGEFEDRATQTVWFRNLPVPKFTMENTTGILKIETEYLVIRYAVNEPFSSETLSVTVKETNRRWHYGDNEHHNLKGTARTLDGVNGATPLGNGVLSREGFATLDDSKALVFNEHYWLTPRKSNNIDLYFFGHGHDYKAALNDYYTISGKTPLIPRYILGNWWSRYWEYSEESLTEVINEFKNYQIPLSVCIIDMDWHIVHVDPKYIKDKKNARWGYGWTGYTWNKELFPDPERFLTYLHDNDLKVSLNLHPADGIRAHEACYEEVADFMGVNKEEMEPVNFDIADPKFVSAYFDLVHRPHENMGVDFWWLDWQQGTKTNLSGLDPLWMLNHLHFYDSGRSPDRRPFTFSRFASNGCQRYPIGFSGDTFVTWDSLNFQPYFTSTASNIGYGWWSHDIGGHMGGIENSEIYTRWVQYGVFSPIFRLHSTKNPLSRREPWSFDQNALKVVSHYMRLRHQLIPYIYTFAYTNYTDNLPLVRPLYYEDQSEDSYRYRNEYFFGSELLVAPITKPMDKVTHRILHPVYLPAGEYFNIFTKEYYQGGQVIKSLYKLEDTPVFAKAGAIIPLAELSTKNGTALPKKLVVEIYPLATNTFTLFEDDGISQNYLNHQYNLTTFNLYWGEQVTFNIEKQNMLALVENRYYKLIFNCITKPEQVIINGGNVESSYHYDDEQLVVEILGDDFTCITIELGNVAVIRKDLRYDLIVDMLRIAEVDNWKKQDLLRILEKELPVSEKIKELLNVENMNSEVIVEIINLLE